MKHNYKTFVAGVLGLAGLLLCSCRSPLEITEVQGETVAIDSTWDARPDADALALLQPYKAKLDSIMLSPIGKAAVSMDRFRPESPLSNLVADVLREAATPLLGHAADMGLVNMGGIRNSLEEGVITTGNIYEILPFENSLCVLTMKGSVLKRLCENIASRGGEGVSGIKLTISKGGKLLQALVGGQPIDEARDYTVATIDYLAEGNDGMTALPQAHQRECPPGATLRSLFMEYVQRQAAAGIALHATIEGRILLTE